MYAPHALPMYREEQNSKKRKERSDRKDPVRSKKPDPPVSDASTCLVTSSRGDVSHFVVFSVIGEAAALVAYYDGGRIFRVKRSLNDWAHLNPKSSEICHFFSHNSRRVPRPWDFFIRYKQQFLFYFVLIGFWERDLKLSNCGTSRKKNGAPPS